tara:strand:- start:688 stop:903 length:216 start_codon:yes stop_codon:yes gene_type:complete
MSDSKIKSLWDRKKERKKKKPFSYTNPKKNKLYAETRFYGQVDNLTGEKTPDGFYIRSLKKLRNRIQKLGK